MEAYQETKRELYRVFTVKHELVKPYAIARPLTLAGAAVQIWAVTVGQQGRGRCLGVLPVEFQGGEPAGEEIRFSIASLSETRMGRPKLIVPASPDPDQISRRKAIVVLLTEPGFRGSCGHAGERIEIKEPEADSSRPETNFFPFPGKILVEGRTAQGDAGRMGGGPQIVALVYTAEVFSAWRRGRLYGAPAAHFYMFDGERIFTATWKERQILPEDHPLHPLAL